MVSLYFGFSHILTISRRRDCWVSSGKVDGDSLVVRCQDIAHLYSFTGRRSGHFSVAEGEVATQTSSREASSSSSRCRQCGKENPRGVGLASTKFFVLSSHRKSALIFV